MKMFQITNKRILIASVLFFTLPALNAFGTYPPDNAAVLYYQSFVLMQDDPNITSNQISQYAKGKIAAPEGLSKYLDRNRTAINIGLKAATLSNCDWGVDLANWDVAPMPHLNKCRWLVYLISADARMKSETGKHKEALDEYLLIYKISRHVGDDTIVSLLCARSFESFANKGIQDILPYFANDTDSLVQIDAQLSQFTSAMPSFKVAFVNETNIWVPYFSRARIMKLIDLCGDEPLVEQARKQFESGDEKLIAASKANWQNAVQQMRSYFDLEYPKAFAAIKELTDSVRSESNKHNKDAILTILILPNSNLAMSQDLRVRSQFNALRAAIQVYIGKNKTGKIPESLPAQSPPDLFSGKPFTLQKTDDGFILRCQEQDLAKKEVPEFLFKVEN